MTLPAPDSQVPPAGAARADGHTPAGACEATSEPPADAALAEHPHPGPQDPEDHGASPSSRAAGLLGPTEVRGLSQALGIRPTKTLGQNFVHDAGTVRRIVRSAGVRPQDTVLEALPSLKTITVMVQAEVADRLAAAPGSRTYGVPSVKAAWYAAARRTLTISRHVFWPVPNVDSALIELVRRRPPATRATREQVFAVVDAAFAQRRKTLRKALARMAGGTDAAESALRAAGIDPARRGETLDITAFAALAEALHPIDADGAAASTPPTTSQEQS